MRRCGCGCGLVHERLLWERAAAENGDLQLIDIASGMISMVVFFRVGRGEGPQVVIVRVRE